MRTSQETTKIAVALNKAQSEMLPLIKDAENPFFKKKYADLFSVTSACYPALQSNGISVIQSSEKLESGLNVITRLMHVSGEYIETDCGIPPVSEDPQKYGSAITYGRRYGLQAAVGLAPEDDDANAASQGVKKAAKKATPIKPLSDVQLTNLTTLAKKSEMDEDRLAKGVGKASKDRVFTLKELSDTEAATLIAMLTKIIAANKTTTPAK